MAEAQRPVAPTAMDPPHITEFASERYFEKLKQLNLQQQQQQQQQPQTAQLEAGQSSTSTFILPLRESTSVQTPDVTAAKPVEKKSRFFGLRHKTSLLHSKQTVVEPELVPSVPKLRTSVDSTKTRYDGRSLSVINSQLTIRRSIPFDQLFLSLPNELQMQIVTSLPLPDVLNLRRMSKSWHALITLNEKTIVRYHLDHSIPPYALRLYPVDETKDMNFHYLCSLWHRLHVAAKLAFLMCEWITKDIFLRQTPAQKAAFAPQHERMRRRLIPLLFTVFHFFETYRKLHLQHLDENDGKGLSREPYTINPIEKQILDKYDDRTLLRVHEVFPLVISSFCRRLRPPTYVGRVERSLRGYIKDRPSDDVHVAILCLGGMRQVERLWEIKGYNSRRTAVDNWYNALTKEKEPTSDLSSKPRLGLFGRKKSTSGERPAGRLSFSDGSKVRSPSGSIDASASGFFDQFIFNTSLAADMPMGPLEPRQAEKILGDLPVLQQIWLTSAEATILDRKIVQRPQDIKRNQDVMQFLIREDGIEEEDAWWYGSKMPEHVQPAADGVDDDAE